MTEKKRIMLPENEFSPVEYFLKIESCPERVSKLFITKSALKKQAKAWDVKNNGGGIFSGKPIIIEAKKFSTQWKIEHGKKGYYIAWLKAKGKRYTFQGKEIEYMIDC